MDWVRPTLLRVTCAPLVTPYLQSEAEELGYAPEAVHESFIDLRGTLRDAMRLNLHLRTALAVLYFLHEFPCGGPEDLYDGVHAFPWEALISPSGYVSVDARGDHPSMRRWTFANQKVKDAIVDRILERTGARPDSGPDRRGIVINAFWRGERCQVFLNTSGAKLSDRGYRRIPHSAPMQETLAAAVLRAAGYDGADPLINPMCGSGTLAIEAALIATGRPPGLLRAEYGMMRVLDFPAAAWADARRIAAKQRRDTPPAPIVASDHDPRAIEAARANAATAGVDRLIEFHVCDFADTPLRGEGGHVIVNPEYGERLGQVDALARVYERIGDFFKQRCAGRVGYVFTGNRELAKRIGLRPRRRIPFYNARIECRLYEFELYAGRDQRKRR